MPRRDSEGALFLPSRRPLSPCPSTAQRSLRAPLRHPDTHLPTPAPLAVIPTGLGTPRGHLIDHLSSIMFSKLKLDPSGDPEELKCFPESDQLHLGASSALHNPTMSLTTPRAVS